MAVSVRIPVSLARLFPRGVPSLDLEASSVAEVIDALDQRWPGMRDRILDERGLLRPHLKVFVDGDDSRPDTPLGEHSQVVILAAVSGGQAVPAHRG